MKFTDFLNESKETSEIKIQLFFDFVDFKNDDTLEEVNDKIQKILDKSGIKGTFKNLKSPGLYPEIEFKGKKSMAIKLLKYGYGDDFDLDDYIV